MMLTEPGAPAPDYYSGAGARVSHSDYGESRASPPLRRRLMPHPLTGAHRFCLLVAPAHVRAVGVARAVWAAPAVRDARFPLVDDVQGARVMAGRAADSPVFIALKHLVRALKTRHCRILSPPGRARVLQHPLGGPDLVQQVPPVLTAAGQRGAPGAPGVRQPVGAGPRRPQRPCAADVRLRRVTVHTAEPRPAGRGDARAGDGFVTVR